jgi:hypothetical protein
MDLLTHENTRSKPMTNLIPQLLAAVSTKIESGGHGTKAECARAIGVSWDTLNRYLTGKRQPTGEITLRLQAWAGSKAPETK